MSGMRWNRIRAGRRHYVQLITAVLYNCHLEGFVTGKISKTAIKSLCTPGLNCYSCPGAVFSCPLGSIQSALAKSVFRFPLYIVGTLLLFGILFGRMICGFFCPFGLIQELIYRIPLPKLKKSRMTRYFSYFKYVILVFFVIVIPLTQLTPGFCKYICPAGSLEAAIPLILLNENLRKSLGWLFSWKVFFLALCVILCSFCYRAFCRFFCPLGAIYSLLNPISYFGIYVEQEKCIGSRCNACIKKCKLDTIHVGDRECIMCGECVSACPKNVIGYKGLKVCIRLLHHRYAGSR